MKTSCLILVAVLGLVTTNSLRAMFQLSQVCPNFLRASTPVSDRSFKGATPGPQGGSGSRRNIDDDLQSTSSREDDRLAVGS